MKVKFIVDPLTYRQVKEAEVPDDTIDSDLQEAARNWALERINYWFEVVPDDVAGT